MQIVSGKERKIKMDKKEFALNQQLSKHLKCMKNGMEKSK